VGNTLNIFGPEAILNGQAPSGVEELIFSPNQTDGWISFGLLLLLFICFRLIYCFFQQSKAELVHLHITFKHFEEHGLIIGNLRRTLMLLSVSIIAFVLLVITRQINYFDAIPDSLETYLLILAALVVFSLLKTFIIYLLGYLSKTVPHMQIIVYYSQLHIIIGSLLLFPLLVLFFNEQDLGFAILKNGAIIICVSMFLLYLMRCWQIFGVGKVPVFFRILYLCTLEFVPFLIIYKYISLG
jgi:hypothetical protein